MTTSTLVKPTGGIGRVEHARVNPAGGPVCLFFDPLATDPGADHSKIFGAAALLWQDGVTLATFSGIGLREFSKAPGWWATADRRDQALKLKKLVPMEDNQELNAAFGHFVLWSWYQVWQAFSPALPDHHGTKLLDDVVRQGRFHVVHSGYLMQVEESFFFRAQPDRTETEKVFGYTNTASFSHPHYLQKFSSLMVGLGYIAHLAYSDEANLAMGWTESSYMQPIIMVERMADLLGATRRRDPRLDPFRLNGW